MKNQPGFLLYCISIMLESKSILTSLIPDCSVLRTLTILKNIRNSLIFLRKMATYSCFWQVPRSEIFLQASLRQISDLLTLVSIYPAVKSDTSGTPPCTAVKKTKSYDFVQHQKPGTCFLMQASATTPIYCPDVWIFVLHGYVCVLLTSKTDTFLLCM